MNSLTDQLTALFEQTGKAHHEAFAAVDGADDDWPIWYAEYLMDKFPSLKGKSFAKNELAELLTQLSKEHATNAPATPWPSYYAKFFIDHYA
ncbi:MAG: hypothetical protein ABI690_20735 [Chloroflexota bacterium]